MPSLTSCSNITASDSNDPYATADEAPLAMANLRTSSANFLESMFGEISPTALMYLRGSRKRIIRDGLLGLANAAPTRASADGPTISASQIGLLSHLSGPGAGTCTRSTLPKLVMMWWSVWLVTTWPKKRSVASGELRNPTHDRIDFVARTSGSEGVEMPEGWLWVQNRLSAPDATAIFESWSMSRPFVNRWTASG